MTTDFISLLLLGITCHVHIGAAAAAAQMEYYTRSGT